jgi:DNA polymerase-4
MSAEREILHVDMDAFFASIEQRDRPELRGRPVIVGAPPDRRGVVATCSYEARRFGVRSAMPSREAARRCPAAVFLPPDMARYAAVARQVQDVLGRFTPHVEQLSIDESFLDVTGSRRLFGDGAAIAGRIRETIRGELGLTASVGVAGNRFLAKLGSKLAKPDGLMVMPRGREALAAFLAPLPVGRLPGAGQVLGTRLAAAGYRLVGDLQRAERPRLAALVGDRTAGRLLQLAFGEDSREIGNTRRELSISREHTFDRDCDDPRALRRTLRELAEDVGRRLRADGRFATVGRLKLRWADFRTITRQRPFGTPARDDFALRELALALLAAEKADQPVRLLGFGVSGLVEQRREQLDLFDDNAARRRARREALSATLDRLRERLGERCVRCAAACEAPQQRRAPPPSARAARDDKPAR